MWNPEVNLMEFFPELDVSALQAEAIARGLYAVALVDGVHERELALISDVYWAASEGGRASATSIERAGPLEAKDVAQLLLGDQHRELFVKTAFLLAWCDGQVTAAERAKIAEYAKALDVSAEAQAKLEAQVKDYLLRPLAGLSNVEAVSAVVKKLGA
jgi:tellurite resistance protein